MRVKASLIAPILALVVYLLLFASGYIDPSLLQYRDSIYLSLIVMQLIIFVLPGIFYCKLKGEGFGKRMRLRPFTPTGLLLIFVALMTLFFGSALIQLGIYYITSGNTEFLLYDSVLSSGSASGENPLYMILTFALLPALTEEFVFRGVLLPEYEGSGGFCAVLMSSVLFAMLHFDPAQLPVLIFGGVIFALTSIVTRSLFASMVLHALNNILSLFLERYLVRFMEQPQSTIFFIFSLSLLFLISLFLFLSTAERIYYQAGLNGVTPPEPTDPEASKLKLLFEAIISPTFLLCVLVFIVASLIG